LFLPLPPPHPHPPLFPYTTLFRSPSPRPGYGWWTNRDNTWKSVPRDLYLGSGAGHQSLIVIPSLDMIVVRNGRAFDTPEPYWAQDRKSTRLNSSHQIISYAVFCLK